VLAREGVAAAKAEHATSVAQMAAMEEQLREMRAVIVQLQLEASQSRTAQVPLSSEVIQPSPPVGPQPSSPLPWPNGCMTTLAAKACVSHTLAVSRSQQWSWYDIAKLAEPDGLKPSLTRSLNKLGLLAACEVHILFLFTIIQIAFALGHLAC